MRVVVGGGIPAYVRAGYLKGADLRHVANALYARRGLGDLAFITLDVRQRTVARTLGFPV